MIKCEQIAVSCFKYIIDYCRLRAYKTVIKHLRGIIFIYKVYNGRNLLSHKCTRKTNSDGQSYLQLYIIQRLNSKIKI